MTTPSLKSLALAAVEADAAMKKENHLTTKYALLKESHDALGAFHSVATPERILQYMDRIEALEKALKPFAEEVAEWPPEIASTFVPMNVRYTVGDLRRAARAYAGTTKGELT